MGFLDNLFNMAYKKEMKQFNKEYSVKTSMQKDEDRNKDGGIEFDLKTIFDNLFENGSET